MKRSAWWFVFFIIAIPFVAYGLVSWYQREYGSLPLYGPPNHRLLDFNLTNQDGNLRNLKDWEDKIVIVNFFFTSCPSICPKMANNLKMLVDKIPSGYNVEVASFTVDPEKDDVPHLKKYAAKYEAPSNWNFFTGSKKDIYRLARNSFLVVATDGDGGDNDFIHSEKLILVDKLHRIRGFYDGTDEAQVALLINDVKKLHGSNKN